MLKKQGLYDPQFEHDGCGVGVVANIKGVKSHDIIRKGLEILANLSHRGACGCDPLTGDGGGVLIQMPHEFMRRHCAELGIDLPSPGEYGVGMLFLPQEPGLRGKCQEIVERIVEEEGQHLLGWRDVPVDNSGIGVVSREVEPHISQVFIGKGEGIADEASFERKLYVVRRVIEKAVQEAGISDADFYIPSLSNNKIVYKGQLMGTQVEGYFLDLADESMITSFALVHSRFSTNTLGSWKLAHPYRFICHNGEINTPAGQHQLDDRAPGHLLLAPLRRRHAEAIPHYRLPWSERHRHHRQRHRAASAYG